MMAGDDPLHSLEAAASLPPHDPLRREVEESCAAAGGDEARRWLGALADGERLRLELHRVEVPDDLAERLASIPDRVPRRAS